MGEPAPALVAPFALLRVAGLPLSSLAALAPPNTRAQIDAARAASAAMEATRGDLVAALGDAVPALSRPGRRAALAVRRAVHNRRPQAHPPHVPAELSLAVGRSGGAALQRWLEASRRLHDCTDTAERTAAEELRTHVRPMLWQLAARETFRRPLALASPSLLRSLAGAGDPPDTERATKEERSLLAYLMRAAAKTSPFSTFMHVAVLEATGCADGPRSLSPSSRSSRTALSRGLVFALRTAGHGCCGDLDHAAFAKSPTVTWVAEGARTMAPAFAWFDGRILRLSRPLTHRLDPAVAARLARLPERLRLRDLAALGTLDPAGTARELLDAGVVTLDPWADAFTVRPERARRATLDRCPSAAGRRLRTALDEMGRTADALRDADSAARLDALGRIRALADRCGADTGIAGAATIDPVVEDGYFAQPAGPMPGGLAGLVDEVAAVLWPRVERRAHHVALCELFVELFGDGGTCYDTVGFLCLAASELSRRRRSEQPPAPFAAPAERPRVPVTILMQPADGDGGTAGAHALAVVNAVHGGCGQLTARHAAGDAPAQAILRDGLRSWLRTVTAPLEPVDLLVSGDCNELQAHPRLTERVLACPLEPTLSRDALSWRDLTLRHRTGSGEIEIHARDERIAPVYLGATFPHPGWGPTYWLTVLAAPWRVRRFGATGPRGAAGDAVVHHERRTIGRVVTRRASWWTTTDRIRRTWFRRTGGARLVDIALDCDRLRIPERFYVTLRSSTRTLQRKEHRKPFWIDTRNPLLVDVLERLLGDAEHLRIVEPLPDLPRWPRLDAEAHVSEVQVELAL